MLHSNYSIPSFTTQRRGKDPSLTQCQQSQKVVCFTKVGGTLSVANYNAVPDFVVVFCINLVC